MAIPHLLPDFESQGARGARISLTDISLEEQRLESFEQGFKAGWDDALKSQGRDQDKISSEFSHNLQDLSFTYHEAYAQVMKSVDPLLHQIVEKVLPEIARQTIGPHVIEQLLDMAREHATQNVQITVAPTNFGMMEALVSQEVGFPVNVIQEPSLGEGQVYLKFESAERQIDMADVLNGISKAITAFSQEIQKESVNG